jgi:cell division protein FtsW
MSENKAAVLKKKKKHGFLYLRMVSGSDIWIHVAMVVLMLFGLIMIGSASMGLAVGNNTYLLKTVGKQLVFIIIGYLMMTTLSNRFKLSFLKSRSFPIVMFVMEIALLACLVFSAVGGARAWIRLPLPGLEITIQPSEFAKIIAMLIVAAYAGDTDIHFKNEWDSVKRPIIFIGIFVVTVLVLQSDLGSAAVIFLISCVCLLIPKNAQMRRFQRMLRVLFWIMVAAVVLILSPEGSVIIKSLPIATYMKNRFLSAINPFSDQYGSGYQLVNGLTAFATGGWFGLGFGNSIRKYMDFPAANTDFILAIIVEELGFAGFLFLMILYGTIIFRMLSYAIKIKSERAKIILVGTSMYFLIHIFFNIGGVTGLIPLTGVPLLLVSAGGSSAMSIMACVGIAQSVISAYKNGEIE